MFGNSYTALVIQVNSQYAGDTIWERLKTNSLLKDIERLRIRYFDLVVIVLQGTTDVIASIRETLHPILYSEFDNLMKSHAISVETCSQLAKNTFSRGREVDEDVDSVECVRMSLVFHGFADILPFLTLLNVSQASSQSSPPPASPLGNTPRPPINPPINGNSMQGSPPPRNPMQGSPLPRNPLPRNPPPRNLPPKNPIPRNPIPRNPIPRNPPPRNPPPRNPSQPIDESYQRSFQPPRRIYPQQAPPSRPTQIQNLHGARPNSRPPYQPRSDRPYQPPNQSPRNMYQPRSLPPRPTYSNPPPRSSYSGPPRPYSNNPRPYK